MLHTTPVPPIDGNPYPEPGPPGGAAAAADAGFTGWASSLGPIAGQLAGLVGDLGHVWDNLQSTAGALGQAVQQVNASGLPGSMNDLVAELGKPNPIGTAIPFSFTAPQLPSAIPPTQGYSAALDNYVTEYLGNLFDFLVSLGYIPPLG